MDPEQRPVAGTETFRLPECNQDSAQVSKGVDKEINHLETKYCHSSLTICVSRHVLYPLGLPADLRQDLQTCLPTWAQDRGKICAGSARLVKRNHLSSTLKLIGLGTRVADTSEEEGEGETNGEGGGVSRGRTYNT